MGLSDEMAPNYHGEEMSFKYLHSWFNATTMPAFTVVLHGGPQAELLV